MTDTSPTTEQAVAQRFMLYGEPGNFTEILRFDTDAAKAAASAQMEAGAGTQLAGVKIATRPIRPEFLLEFYYQNAVHAGCCDAKAEDVVGGGFTIEGRREGEEAPQNIVEEFSEVVDRSVGELVTAQIDAERVGWGVFELLPSRGGGLHSFNHIDAHTIYVASDRSCYVHSRDNRNVLFSPVGVQEAGRNQLAYLINKSFYKSTYYGVPDATSVVLQMQMAYEGLKHNQEFFARRGGYRWMMTLQDAPGSTGGNDGSNATSDANLIQQINLEYSESGKNSNSDLLMIPLGKRTAILTRLDADMKDMDFVSLFNFTRNEVLMAHRTPPIKVGIVETGALGGDNSTQQIESYRDSVVLPKQRRWNALMEQIIEAWYGVRVKFTFNPVEIATLAKMALPVSQLVRDGLVYRDQALRLLGLPPVDDGEEIWADQLPTGGVFAPMDNEDAEEETKPAPPPKPPRPPA